MKFGSIYSQVIMVGTIDDPFLYFLLLYSLKKKMQKEKDIT